MQLKLLYVCVICWEGCDVHTDFFLTSGCTWGCFCLLTHFCTFCFFPMGPQLQVTLQFIYI